MGKIDGETRIAARGAQPDFLRLDEHHMVIGEIQCKLPGSRQPGESGSDNDPPGSAVASVSGLGITWQAQMKPATTIIIGGQ
ncbi:hypothetical protein PSCICO_39130 [Pseudomonas cichorii]|nr:hypothetical protein PSCICO_39130 [Pseudomonas cichorii]